MTATEGKKTDQDKMSNKATHTGGAPKHSGHRLMHSKNMWFAFITVFISGTVIGASCVAFLLNPPLHPDRNRPDPRNDMVQKRIIPHMTKTLNLSKAQQDEAKKIMINMSNQLREIRKQQAPKIRAIIQSSFAEIKQLLNEKQKVKFIEMQRRIKLCRVRSRAKGLKPPFNKREAARPPQHKYQGRGRMAKQKNSATSKSGKTNEEKE